MPTIAVGAARLRIEEVEALVYGNRLQVLIVDAVNAVVHITVLQVAIEGQFLLLSVDNVPVGFGIDVRVQFVARGAVVLIIKRQRMRIERVADIRDVAPMLSLIIADGSSEAALHIVSQPAQREYASVEMVAEVLEAHKVGAFHLVAVAIHIRRQAESGELLARLVLLVVAAAMRVVERGVQPESVRQPLGEMKACMLLGIVVGLVLVVRLVALIIHISAGRIVATVRAVQTVRHVITHAVPSHIRALLSSQKREFESGVAGHIPHRPRIGIEVGRRTVEKAIGVHFRETTFGIERVGQCYLSRYHLAESVVHAPVERQLKVIGDRFYGHGLHVDRCSKRRTAVLARPHSTLHIQ